MSSPIFSITTLPSDGTSATGRASRQLYRGLIALIRAVLHRREVTQLLDLDDRALKDIGLVRNDVLGALAEPLGSDPSIVLRLRSVDHRARLRALAVSRRHVAG